MTWRFRASNIPIMRTIVINALCLITLCAVVQVFGQERAITAKQFTDIDTSTTEALKSRKYRSNKETHRGKETGQVVTVFEFVPPDRSRSRIVDTTQYPARKTEIIKIGDIGFLRYDDGPWISPLPPRDPNRYTISGDRAEAKIERTEAHTLSAGSNLGNEKADLYSETKTFSYESVGMSFKTVSVKRLWINKDGLLIRDEYTVHDGKGNRVHYSLVVYEYDPDLTIAAPEVKPPAKKN